MTKEYEMRNRTRKTECRMKMKSIAWKKIRKIRRQAEEGISRFPAKRNGIGRKSEYIEKEYRVYREGRKRELVEKRDN